MSADQLFVSLGQFDDIELLALDILDESVLAHLRFIQGGDHRTDHFNLRQLARTPAALA